jgi:hypothetical protein
MWSRGEQICLVVEHASWSVAVIAIIHFECCLTGFPELYSLSFYGIKLIPTNMDTLGKV